MKKYMCLTAMGVSALLLTSCGGVADYNSFQNQTVGQQEAIDAKQQEKERVVRDYAGEPYTDELGQSYYFQVEGDYFEVYNGEDFTPLFLKGMNIGAGKPGAFPGELSITKEEYLTWFQQIADMNCNCIRVYTVLMPDFYDAFYEYNMSAQEPLYLFQGTWYDEKSIGQFQDAYEESLQTRLYHDMYDLVDIIHGNCEVAPEAGYAYGFYTHDISPWVMGWILGIEPDHEFVNGTNEAHPEHRNFDGEFIAAEDVSPYEVFWAETADEIVRYELENYSLTRPLAVTNWPTTDVMEHPSETMEMEDGVSLSMENLTAKKFGPGLFASYHIYSYYPNFMYTEEKYRSYVDSDGKTNTYKAYLEDLKSHHTMPILVAEFGIPSCQGEAHNNIYTGYDQGHKTEVEQGEILADLMKDIFDSGYAGGLIFSWQDEWFKRTWNTMDYTEPLRRAYWNDVMTNEQHFGILSFVPGEDREKVVVDGYDVEWGEDTLFSTTEDGLVSLSIDYDAAYLYLKLRKKDAKWEQERIIVSFDVTPNSGSTTYEEYTFDRPVDFVLDIQGKDRTNLYVQDYYDRFRYEYRNYPEIIEVSKEDMHSDSKEFVMIDYLLERALYLPDRNEVVPLRLLHAGELEWGITDYYSTEYNSIADFYYLRDVCEIRIPWGMLNFRDPSTHLVEDDFWIEDYFKGMQVEDIGIGIMDRDQKQCTLNSYTWETWEQYPYFARLRKSYFILKERLSTISLPEEGK